MSETDEFLASMLDRQLAAERSLHGGDAAPRYSTWSHEDPVTLFGAWKSNQGWPAVSGVFDELARHLSECTFYEIDLLAAGASGDLAYTVCHERAGYSLDGVPVQNTLRVTHIYRRENGEWRIVHRHADPPPDESAPITGVVKH